MKNWAALFLLTFSTLLTAQTVRLNEVMSSNTSVLFDEDDEASDWIEIFNFGSETINLENYSITDDESDLQKWVFPNHELAPYEYLIVFASDKNKSTNELHTNFKISSSGEPILLVDNYGAIVDQVEATEIASDYSIGRSQVDPSEWLYYPEPTPGNENTTGGYLALSEEPNFSILGGFYPSEQSITLTPESESIAIYYTLDGSDPTESSLEYASPISITETKVLRPLTFYTTRL